MTTGRAQAGPADRYAAYMRTGGRGRASRATASFQAMYDFTFDEFQFRACKALHEGHGVLVAAPTGSGKTVIGEFAVHLAMTHGGKCFYTTPIKALSNQKYGDLVRRYVADQGRPADRGQLGQRRRPGGGHDHRGTAEHALRRLARR